MYEVLLGNKILYYPGNDEFSIYDTELTEDIGQAGEFTFKVPPTNPLYSQLTSGALVTVQKDHKEVWRGEIRDIKVDFAKIANVYCLEDLAWLADEFLTPDNIQNQTYQQRLTSVIRTYNSTRTSDRIFYVGYVYNGALKCNWKTEYEWSILDSIRQCICRDSLYVKVRRVYENSVLKRYIDVVRLQEYGKAAVQPIEYGYNLLDYVKDSDYGNLTNVLTPYGDELEGEEQYTDYAKRLEGTTIANNDSIDIYGRHAKAVIFDGVTNVNTLNSLANSYLTRYSQPQITMEVNAVDLSTIENVDSFEIGDQIRIIAKPFAIDQDLYLTEIKRDIQRPDRNVITLSGHVEKKTLTSQINKAMETVEELPTTWSLLEAAKKNALSMLLDETQGGYVVFEYDDPDNPKNITAINISNRPTLDESTKRWRWSQNGLGYLERASKNVDWPQGSEIKVAMTSDGHIVADFVDTGTLSAKVIKAGILADKNNKFRLNMENGNLIMNSGTFKGTLSGATGTFSGSLNAATGTFKGSLNAATGSFSGDVKATSGKIGLFDIDTAHDGQLKVGDAVLSKNIIGCGDAGSGIVNIVGGGAGSGSGQSHGYILLANSGDPSTALDGLKIFGTGVIQHFNEDGDEDWYVNLQELAH